jgi:hypothetical protein
VTKRIIQQDFRYVNAKKNSNTKILPTQSGNRRRTPVLTC